MSTDLLRTRKAKLRKSIKAALKQLSHEDIAKQSADVTSKVLNSRAFHSTKSLSIFLSMPDGEISTSRIVEAALADGKNVFVPYIHKSVAGQERQLSMLELRKDERPDTLDRDAWGIPTLGNETVATRRNALGGYGVEQSEKLDNEVPPLDLIFIPAVAFDHDCRRLGHGRGFYDCYLDQYEQSLENRRPEVVTPLLIGLALREQMLPPDESIPVNADDWPVDEVVIAGNNTAPEN